MANIGKGAINTQVNYAVKTVTSDYTVVDGDELILAQPGAGALNVSLPAPKAADGVGGVGNQGQRVVVQKIGAGAGNVVVNGTVASYIRAAGKATLANNGSAVTFISDGSFWNCLGTVS